MTTSHWRGHTIVERDGVWYYQEDGARTDTDPDRPCGHCHLKNTPEGHDGCIKTVPDAMNACCGHGRRDAAYVQYEDHTLRGVAAADFLDGLIRLRGHFGDS